MTGPEFFQTRMGQQFYEVTMPNLAKAIEHLATAFEGEHELITAESIQKRSSEFEMEKLLTKEWILKHANEDELFCLVHTFWHYLAELWKDEKRTEINYVLLDSDIGKVIERLKKTYK